MAFTRILLPAGLQVCRDLLAYCALDTLDTLAMLKIAARLRG
jgi:hypothetical protein